MKKTLMDTILVALFFAVPLPPGTAHASDASREVSLAEVIAGSDWIGTAEYLGPDKEISAGYRFRAIETLMNKMGEKQPSGEFVAVTPRAVANAMARQVYNTSGVRRSPLIRRLDEGSGSPGKTGEKCILFVKKHDEKVVVLTAGNAVLPLDKRERVVKMISERGKETEDLIFRGKVESIEIAPLKNSPNNFVVKTRVLKVLQGSFKGKHFSFRIHSPSKSQIVVGKELEVRAKRILEGYFVDPIQFIGR